MPSKTSCPGHTAPAWRVNSAYLAHVLRDVQYAIDCGDTVFAPKVRDHLRWAIGVGRRRRHLKDTTLASYAARADLRLSRMMLAPVAHPAGKALMKQIKAWRAKFFVFLTNRDVPATNNVSEREIRPSVVFRKVTGGFRSDWTAASPSPDQAVRCQLSEQLLTNSQGKV